MLLAMQIIYWVSLVLLYYVYDGYLRVLQLLHVFNNKVCRLPEQYSHFKVTVLITVYNEAAQILEKIHNTLALDYPTEELEILIASDGSTDGIDNLVSNLRDSRIRLSHNDARVGKTGAQNIALPKASGDVILFTDAATRFDRQFLREVCKCFQDRNVGAVDGHLLFAQKIGNALSENQGFYWNYELSLRRLESDLGLLAVASGQCLAVRRPLAIGMPLSIGEDCIVPLNVVRTGAKVIHAQHALAYDYMEKSIGSEFRSRVRMTARNWRGTWTRPELLNPLAHPGYAFGLWSHKLLRWLSPFVLIIMSLSAIAMGILSGGWYWLFMLVPAGVFLGGVTGWIASKAGVKLAPLASIYVFCIANLGFLVGIMKAIFGKAIVTYR